jgi:hypothetical protein
VRARTPARSVLCAGLAGTLALCLAGCGDDAPAAEPTATGPAAPSAPVQARAQLAAHAAAAKDLRYAALYTLTTQGRTDRTVVVTRAGDGGWRVDIPGGALGGTADVSVARTRDGLFQCALPSVENPVTPMCVRVAGRQGQLEAEVDPQVQHVFVDWLEVLTDRRVAIAVSAADALPGVRGACFSVESNSASLAVPLDVGIYCYEGRGTLTGARLSFGQLTLAGALAPPPPAITLPGAVIDGPALPIASPPPPPTTSASATP